MNKMAGKDMPDLAQSAGEIAALKENVVKKIIRVFKVLEDSQVTVDKELISIFRCFGQGESLFKAALLSEEAKAETSSPSISSTGTGDETKANRNILGGILEIAVRQGLATKEEMERRLREFDAKSRANLGEDIDLQPDNQSVFLINGQKVIVIDRDYLSTTEEGEQYASAGLRRGVVYITREKFSEWQEQGILEQKIKHEQDEVAYLRKKALEMFPGDEITAYELMSEFLKNPDNAKEAKALIAEAHNFAKAQSASNAAVDAKAQEQGDNPSRFSKTGGIDFRHLPIVRKAIGNLKPNIGSSAMDRLKGMNLEAEWRDIENSVNSGVIPQAERLREYIQASCLNGNAGQDIDKVISCIADILRLEEERYVSTEPLLQYILIAVESANSIQQLKAAFIGTTP